MAIPGKSKQKTQALSLLDGILEDTKREAMNEEERLKRDLAEKRRRAVASRQRVRHIAAQCSDVAHLRPAHYAAAFRQAHRALAYQRRACDLSVRNACPDVKVRVVGFQLMQCFDTGNVY
jgi:hypothetical protein